MLMIFLGLLAKLARPTIVPTTPSQSIHHPKSILQSQPSVVLCLWHCPSVLNDFVQARLHKAKKLQLICGSRRMLPITGKFPSDIILHVHTKVHPLNVSPKLQKLGKVVDRSGGINSKFSNPLILMKRLGHQPTFSLANFEFFLEQCLWALIH
jgi:hypothetical protein